VKPANASVAGVVVAGLVFMAYGSFVFEGLLGTVVIAIALVAITVAVVVSRRQTT
jgi:hypothetical protein